MKLDYKLWQKANELLTYGDKVSIEKLQDLLKISNPLARQVMFLHENKTILNYKIESFDRKQKSLVLADIHFPYQDDPAYCSVLNYIEDKEYDKIVLLGDVLDFGSISFFTKSPTKKTVNEEINVCKDFLKMLRNKYPNAKIYYYEGNHEERLKRAIWRKLPEIDCITQNLMQNLLGLNELDITFIDSPFQIGKLWHAHGDEKAGQGNPEYITNVLMQYFYDNFIVGHFHRGQSKVYKRINGEAYIGTAVGWLGGHDACKDYAELNKWTHGFVEVDYDTNGNFRITNHTIVNGIIY